MSHIAVSLQMTHPGGSQTMQDGALQGTEFLIRCQECEPQAQGRTGHEQHGPCPALSKGPELRGYLFYIWSFFA